MVRIVFTCCHDLHYPDEDLLTYPAVVDQPCGPPGALQQSVYTLEALYFKGPAKHWFET